MIWWDSWYGSGDCYEVLDDMLDARELLDRLGRDHPLLAFVIAIRYGIGVPRKTQRAFAAVLRWPPYLVRRAERRALAWMQREACGRGVADTGRSELTPEGAESGKGNRHGMGQAEVGDDREVQGQRAGRA